MKEYVKSNNEVLQEKRREYYLANRDRILASVKLYKKTNRAAINSQAAKSYKNNPEALIARRLRNRLGNALMKCHTSKSDHTLALLGCSLKQFKQHIESQFKEGMNWDNHNEWHLDHIVPCSSFDLTIPEQQQRCFHYSNLQPLWAFENLFKSDTLY